MSLDHATPIAILRRALVTQPLCWRYVVRPFFEGLESSRPDLPSIYDADGRWYVIGQPKRSGRIRSWMLGRAVRAWRKAYEKQQRFQLTAEEEALLEAELSDSALMAQFASLEAADRRERKKQREAPIVNGFFRGAQRRLNTEE